MRARFACLLAGLLIALGLLATSAFADGDPASDVLLGENVFYPYTPPVSTALQNSLNAATDAAAKAHFPVKVALIASPVDLGVIPALFGKPQEYADFLDREISFTGPQTLLVVMADGYGVQGMDGAAVAAAAALPKPAGGSSDELARAALAAIPKLARAAGHPLGSAAGGSASSGSSTRSRGSSTAIVLTLVIIAALASTATLIVMRRRQVIASRRRRRAARF